jgi:hypothetical protein
MAGLHNRPFVGRRFRCSTIRHDGTVCGGFGEPTIEPPERRRIDDTFDTELVFLFCRRLGDAGNLTGEAWRTKPVKLSASSSGHNLHTQRWPGFIHSDCRRTPVWGGLSPAAGSALAYTHSPTRSPLLLCRSQGEEHGSR